MNENMNQGWIAALLARVTVPDLFVAGRWLTEKVCAPDGSWRGTMIGLRFEAAEGPQVSRKWYVSRWATESEVLQTALACVLMAAEHEMREQFLVDGRPIYGPHWPAETLIENFPGDHNLDRREVAA